MLSKKSKYAISALVHLARKYGADERVLISDISEKERIPKKFLETILLELKNAGILGSKKGKGGGYYLIKRPQDVNMAEVIRLFEGAIALLPCASYKYYEPCQECEDEKTCGIKSLFKEVRDHTVNVLKKNSLADILQREQQMKEQLAAGIEPTE